MQGSVKQFDDAKGWGFIQVAGGRDIFVHHSGILMQGHRTLFEGQTVEFDTEPGQRGPKAVNVQVIGEGE